jgi:hypothetical protein
VNGGLEVARIGCVSVIRGSRPGCFNLGDAARNEAIWGGRMSLTIPFRRSSSVSGLWFEFEGLDERSVFGGTLGGDDGPANSQMIVEAVEARPGVVATRCGLLSGQTAKPEGR